MSAAKRVEASLSLSLPTCKMGPRLSAHLPGKSLVSERAACLSVLHQEQHRKVDHGREAGGGKGKFTLRVL